MLLSFRQRRRPNDEKDDDDKSESKKHKPAVRHQAVALLLIGIAGVYVAFHWFGTEYHFSSISDTAFSLRHSTLEPSWPKEVLPTVSSIVTGGSTRICTSAESKRQGELAAAARVRGCPSDDDAWLRFTQAIVPQAKVFIDIGSNKGYTAARFFELWTPEMGVDSRTLHTALKRVSSEPNLIECGACNDCKEVGLSLLPIFQRGCNVAADKTSDPNSARSLTKTVGKLCEDKANNFKPIQVYSFDGNPVMIDGVTKARDLLSSEDPGYSTLLGVNGVPQSRLPKDPKRRFLKRSWVLELAAFSDVYVEGKTVEFLLGIGEKGHLIDESEKVSKDNEVSEQRAIVPVLTIDHFLERQGISHADIIKIDTEGHDPSVLRGARKVIEMGRATMILFEYNKLWSVSDTLRSIVVELMEPNQYVCYLEGKNLLLKLNYGCWSNPLEMRQWSNVWCFSLRKAEGMALASVFDSYSIAFV